MIEDPREVERRRLLGIDDDDAPSRDDLAATLEEVSNFRFSNLDIWWYNFKPYIHLWHLQYWFQIKRLYVAREYWKHEAVDS